MDFRAARAARDYVAEVFEEKAIAAVGLGEIEFDEDRGEWLVTVGFNSKAKADARSRAPLLPTLPQTFYGDRRFKVVRFNDDGTFVFVKDRFLMMLADLAQRTVLIDTNLAVLLASAGIRATGAPRS